MMKLIEVIRGAKTSDETYQVMIDIAKKFGKEVITVNDSPGFVVTRLLVVLTNEAAKMLNEGIATAEDIEKGCTLGLGHSMGPLKTIDITDGVGVTVHCLDYMRAELGDEYRPNPLLKRMVLAGELGRKSGKGFFDYSQK
jgi:3-hydroxybutyryl-CoA dehydrogenase